MVANEEKCDLCGCRGGSTVCYYNCGCHNKQKDEKVLPKNMVTKEEKCDLCGCRGYDTVCYYNCGCHKPNDKEVLPNKWERFL